MTNTQIARIKRDDIVRDRFGRQWIAKHNAFVPDRDTVNAQVALLSHDWLLAGVRRVRILTCKATDF